MTHRPEPDREPSGLDDLDELIGLDAADTNDNPDAATDEDDEGDLTEQARYMLTRQALAEIAKAFAGVDMASMPYIPPDAPCRLPGSDPNDWFDPLASIDMIGVPPSYLDQIATELCEGCPVLAACLIWALDNPLQEGILGGTTHKRRLAMLDQYRRQTRSRRRR